MSEPKSIAREFFGQLSKAHNHLNCSISDTHEYLDLMLDFPAQDGLRFDIHLNLQNTDEIHLEALDLWMCWFPCTDKSVLKHISEILEGLISGHHRIAQKIKKGRVVKAHLEVNRNGRWEKVSSGLMTFKLPTLGKSEMKYTRNVGNGDS